MAPRQPDGPGTPVRSRDTWRASPLFDSRGVHRRDIWQVLRDARPCLAFIAARPHVAVFCFEVQTPWVEQVVVHSFAQCLERRPLRKALLELFPGLSFFLPSVDGHFE